MAPSKKKGAPASASKKAKVAPRRSNKTSDGRPNRAEKSVVNKANNVSAHELVRDIREDIKASGKQVVLDRKLPSYSEWTTIVEQSLYELIGTGHSLRSIAEMPGMPRLIDMLTWLTDDTHQFSLTYARGRQAVTVLYEEEIQRLGTTAQRGIIRTKKQQLTKDGDVVDIVETRYLDNVERSKLAVATLQWTLGHLKPRKHGRTPDTSSSGPNEQLRGLFDSLKAGPVD